MTNQASPTWRDTLAPGDIVAFKFPCSDEPSAEKPRPCLVADVDHDTGEVDVIYGTSRWTSANRGQELHVTEPEARAEASLDRPTRFVGARRVRVSLTSPRFVECRHGTAVLGRLGERYRTQLDRIRTLRPQPSRRGLGYLRRPVRCRATFHEDRRSL